MNGDIVHPRLDRFTWDDRRTIEKFGEFLRDMRRMSEAEFFERYGATYLELTPEQCAKFQRQQVPRVRFT